MSSDDSDEDNDYRQHNRYTDDSFSESRRDSTNQKRQHDRRAEDRILKAAAERQIRYLEHKLFEMEETNTKLKDK